MRLAGVWADPRSVARRPSAKRSRSTARIRCAPFAVAAALAIVLATARVSAECPPAIESWTRECAASAGLAVTLRACHPDGFVVDIHSPDGAVLGVDISRALREPFRRVGDVSIAPMGEFADWKHEPLARQRSLDDVTECVRRAAPSIDLLAPSKGLDDGADSDRTAAVSAAPWLLLAMFASAVVRALSRWLPPRIRLVRLAKLLCDIRSGALLAGLSLTTFAVRWVVVPQAFFHQNGQGPGWVDVAWRRVHNAYGSGYVEVYGWIASRSPHAPEGAIFLANACASAMIPALTYWLVRRTSSSRVIAAAAAIALAIAPISARLAQSESYFVPITWLLFIATLALADAARFEMRSAEFVADVAVAVFAISQAARIHPIAWVPAAITPLVMLTTRLNLRVAIGRAAASTAIVGLGVLLLAGREMWNAIHGSIGHGWMPSAERAFGETPARSLTGIAIAGWLFARAWRNSARSPRLAPLVLLALVVGIAVKTNLVDADNAAVGAAYAGLYAPAVIAIIANGAPHWAAMLLQRRALRDGACGLAIVTSGMVFALASARATCTLPTDARELSWVLGWRRSVSKGAIVCWYNHAGRRMLELPFYRGAEMPRAIRLEDGAGFTATHEAYYVHTSLCATEEGRARCEGFENSHHLVPVERRVLPAIGSLPWLPFTAATVEVVLYRLGE